MSSQSCFAKVLALGCSVGALTIAYRYFPNQRISDCIRRLAGSLRKTETADAMVATSLVEEVAMEAASTTAPTTGLSPCKTAEAVLYTADSAPIYTPSGCSSEAAEAAEVLVADAARIEASAAVASHGADIAEVNRDGMAAPELTECSSNQALDSFKRGQRRAKRKQHKNKCHESLPQCNDPADLEAKKAKAAQAEAELLQQEEEEKAAKEKAAEKTSVQKTKKGKKKPKQAPLSSPGASECLSDDGLAPEDVVSSSHCASGADDSASHGVDAAAQGSVDSAAALDKRRRDWDALLDLAAHCTDAEQQPIMLARVVEMLPSCSDAGISVKYGRKVLQKLQAVAPAREALQSALSSDRITYDELAAALTAAKACRSLLEGHLIQLAEEVLTNLMREQAALTQQQQAQQQHAQEQLLQQPKEHPQQQQRQQDQQLETIKSQQPHRRQAGQQLQMHGPAGHAVPMTSVTYSGTSAKARRGATGPRVAGHRNQQPSAASTSSGMSTAAAARQRHAGRQVVLGSSSSAAPGSAGQVLPLGCMGLRNLGNTCYQNSIVQCLNCLPDLAQPLRHAAQQLQSAVGSGPLIQWKPSASVGPAFAALLAQMCSGQSDQQDSLSPRKFKQAVTGVNKRWGDGHEQDSQEFLLSLLAHLQSESNRIQGQPQYKELLGYGPETQQAAEAEAYARSWHDSLVDDLFGGFLQSSKTCSSCHHQSHHFEPILDVSVPIPKSKQVSVQDCLAAFAAEETLTGSNQVTCSACGKTCDATKRLRISSYPKILILSLNRFNSGSNGANTGFGGSCDGTFSLDKNRTPVNIDGEQLLDLAPYCSSTGLKAAAGKGCRPPRYELLSVCDHFERPPGGHYVARGRSAADGSWYLYDDSSVKKNSCPSGSSSSAYLLFYRLMND